MNERNTLYKELPTIPIELTVNGQKVEAVIEPRETLLDFIRGSLKLKGAKRSCDVEVCGSCTVLLDGLPVSACSTLVYEARGREVLTIEGLSQNGGLAPLQEAFIQHAAVQCGFCTSGMILTAVSLLREHPQPTRNQIASYMRGNLCRCTGYWNVIRAIEEVADQMTTDRELNEEAS